MHSLRRLFIGSTGTAIICAAVSVSALAETGDGGEQASDDRQGEERSLQQLEAQARERELDGGDYPHHDQPRELDGDLDCPDIELIEYEGEVIDYNRKIEINKHFRERLIRFEKMAREVAEEIYGRPPTRLVHAGGHTCKSVGGRGEKLSEHSFGHAIDILGFDFDEVSKDQIDDQVGRAAEGFQVRLEEHWDASSGFSAKHSEFLQSLAEALKRRGPFSAMLGPGYQGHDKFFHLDFGPEFFFRL